MSDALENAKGLYLLGIRDGKPAEAAAAYTGDRYTQHSTGVKDGADGFVEFFDGFLERNPVRDIEIVRSWQDGNLVFLHVAQSLNNGEYKYVTADILEADENGKMIEHWDVIAEMVDETVSGHSQVDGPTEITDLDKTDANKAIVTNFITDVLINGEDKSTDYVSTETYIQHNPQVGDGLEGLGVFLGQLAEQGVSMTYSKIHKIVGSGNFVATLSELDFGGTPMAAMDIFRLDDGLIVEHWDVMEEIGPEDTWVNSGKF